MRRRVHAEAEELKGTTNKAVIPAMVPLQAVQMSSPASLELPPSSENAKLGRRAINSPDAVESTEGRVVITPVPWSLQKLDGARLKVERRAKGRETGGWDAGIMERVSV